MRNHIFSAVVLAAASLAHAQAPAPAANGIAEIVSVNGLVTVTTNNQLTNASKGMPLLEGAQVLTTGSGTATVVFDSGCRVTLKPGQSLLIEETACAAFLATGAGVAAGASTATTFISPTIALLGAGGLGVLALANGGGGTAAAGTTATPVVTPTTPAVAPIVAPAVAPISGA